MTEQKEQPVQQGIVEVEWQEIEKVWNLRELLLASEEQFKNLSLNYEKAKASAMSKIVQTQNALYKTAEELRSSKGIDNDDVYELKLPETSGEKAYFIRKES